MADKRDVSGLNADEAVIVSFGREILVNRRVSHATYEAAVGKYGEKGVTELTATIGYYGMPACALNAFEVKPRPDMPKLP